MDKNKRDHATELNDEMLNDVAGGSAVNLSDPAKYVAKMFCKDCNKVFNMVSGSFQCSECGSENILIPH